VHTVGHLFQGRYKAILCEEDAYLLGLVRYIHRNPVRANHAVAYALGSHEGVALEEMRSRTRVRTTVKARKVFSFIARDEGYTVKEIAAYLSIDGAAVSGYESERVRLTGEAKKARGQLDKT
jgi:hypothetical protein